MSLKIPPVVQFIFFASLSWILKAHFPVFTLNHVILDYFAAGLALAGFLIIIISVAAFLRVKTTVNPIKPDSANTLVASGIFRYSRNPMYLGLLLLLLSFAVYLGDIVAFVPAALFVVFITEFQIKPEEQALREKFGTQYDEYSKRVRRWI